MAQTVTVDATQYYKALDRLRVKAKTKLRSIIRELMKDVKTEVATAASPLLQGRSAKRSISTRVYKKMLGANVNLLGKGGAVHPHRYRPTLKPGQVGGNRRPVSQATISARQMTDTSKLQTLNAGSTNGLRPKNPQRETKYGKRGVLSARDFFGTASLRAMQKMQTNFGIRAEELIAELWEGKTA
ncbi:MAG: hypothetical protein LUC33_02955 [Prevotellaceae bacterium]|nr:hypothetical protein [Prevotellaceae bacterium]